jgi:hypothetical protein
MIFKRKRFKTFVLLFAVIVCGSVLFLNRAFSYNDTVTHPSLTANVAKIYNSNNERKLTDQEIGWLKQGSIEEDKAPRWLNHFYNPQTNQGLWSFPTAKNWSQNPALQSVYLESISGGNQTWQKGISSFAKGDEKAAFIALGHVLHLLEDMTVPAHTRLDPHPSVKEYEDLLKTPLGVKIENLLSKDNIDPHLAGDPYEKWVEQKIGSDIKFDPQIIKINSLNSAFDDLSNFSSKYFLSKDTISEHDASEGYFLKEINGNKARCIIKELNGISFCFAAVKEARFGEKQLFIDDFVVHSDYFSLLAPKAVAYGAGVVKLFFEEAEKAKQEYEQKSWWQKLKEKTDDLLAGLSGSFYAGLTLEILEENETLDEKPASEKEDEPLPSETPLAVAAPTPLQLPPDTVIAREKTRTPLPSSTPSESPAEEIIEEIPLVESPSQITEEIATGLEPLISPSSSPSPSPSATPSPSSSPSGGSASSEPASSDSDSIPPETSLVSQPSNPTSSTTAVFVFDSSEVSSVFSCQLDSATSTDCVSPQEYTGLEAGAHVFKVSAIDAFGNEDSTPVEYSWVIDLPPEVSIDLVNYSLIDFDFSVAWSSSSTDVSYFDAQYKIGEIGDWQDWAMATTTVSKSFEATFDNVIFYFRVRATDLNGFQSSWQETEAPISQKPIIFNEIMYDPNPGADSYYEYIEIYNRAPVAINLDGWQYVVDGSKHALSADVIHDGSDAVLASGGYALITDKTTSTSTPSVYDGLYYAPPSPGEKSLRLKIDDASLDLNNSGRINLILENADGAVIDEVNYVNVWGAQNNGRSLERINYLNIYSDNQLAWQESADGGTPNTQNSALDLNTGTLVPDNAEIIRDAIWSKESSPFLLYSNSGVYPTVKVGVKLIIEPGVVIKPQNKYYYSLYVEGTLWAQGTETEKILFTSKEEIPLPGDWGTAIYFDSQSVGSRLSYVTFEYGGFELPWPNPGLPAAVVNGAAVDFDYCIFSNSQAYALELINSDSAISHSQFNGTSSVAVYVSGAGSPEINNNIFQSSGYQDIGLQIDNGAVPNVENNTFTGFYQPIWLQSAYPAFSGNAVTDNAFNGVYVDDQTVISQDTVWSDNLTYLLESNSGQFSLVATSTTLTIEPGTTIKPLSKFYTALKIEGKLLADGNSSSTLINFTSFKDDSVGGDANNDMASSAPDEILGDWQNIVFAAGSESTLRYISFQYGGYGVGGRDKDKSLEIETGAMVVKENVCIE